MPILPKGPGGEEAIRLESMKAKPEGEVADLQLPSFLASQLPCLPALKISADQNTR